jgi:hypothetical protein
MVNVLIAYPRRVFSVRPAAGLILEMTDIRAQRCARSRQARDDLDRNALDDLGEISVALSGGRTRIVNHWPGDLLDMAFDNHTRQGIHGDLDRIAFANIGELCLL